MPASICIGTSTIQNRKPSIGKRKSGSARSAPQFLENLLRALQRFKGGTLCVAAAEKIASRPEIFSPVTLVVPAIERICVGRRQMIAAVHEQPSASVGERGGVPAPAQRGSSAAAIGLASERRTHMFLSGLPGITILRS